MAEKIYKLFSVVIFIFLFGLISLKDTRAFAPGTYCNMFCYGRYCESWGFPGGARFFCEDLEDSCTPKCNKTCTPTCARYPGTSFDYSGPLCNAGRSRCSYSNGCGGKCYKYGDNCYYPETNLQTNVPSNWAPTHTSMIVGNRAYQLSTDPATPTTINVSSILTAISQIQDSNKTLKTDNTVEARSNVMGTMGRIPLGSSTGDKDHIRGSSVLVDEGVYKMWYSGSNGNYRIYYATSNDGLTWNKYNNVAEARSNTTGTEGRIPLGMATTGIGDRAHVYHPSVIRDGDTYKMWYTGEDSGNVPRIYMATSSDGLIWTKENNSIPSRDDSTNGRIALGASVSGVGDKNRVSDPSVIKDGTEYKMWYAGYDGSNWRIYMATSVDGLTWNKVDNSTPINSNDISTQGRIPRGEAGTGDRTHVRSPIVIKDADVYKMWYTGYDGSYWRIFYATSTDGYTWIKQNNAVPSPARSNDYTTDGRITRGSSGGDATHASFPSAIKSGGKIIIYYSGSNGTWRIYRAEVNDDYPVKVSMPVTSALPGSRDILYEFKVDNYGSNQVWFGGTECMGVNGEDFCNIDINNAPRFVPAGLGIGEVLSLGSSGKVMGSYHSLNLCDDSTIQSTTVNGYYKINSGPEIVLPCPMDTSIAEDDPRCTPCVIGGVLINANIILEDERCTLDEEPEECKWNKDLMSNNPACKPPEEDKKKFLPEVGSDMTQERCKSEEYTGKEINNPLRVRISGVDADGNDEIEGVLVAFTKSSISLPIISEYGEYTYSDMNNLAILLKRNGSDPNWDNEPLIYGLTHNGVWGELSGDSRSLKNSLGSEIVTVLEGITVNMRGNDDGVVTFEMQLNFKEGNDDNPGGIFDFRTAVLDRYMLEGIVDQSMVKKYFDWGIDLVDPVVEKPEQAVSGPQQLNLTISANDTDSNITDLIIDTYKRGYLISGTLKIISPSQYLSYPILEVEDEPPLIDLLSHLEGIYDLNSWHFGGIGATIYEQTFGMDIGMSEGETMVIRPTVFDQGCNLSNKEHRISLAPWIATKGGIAYSSGSFGPGAKDVLDEQDLGGLTNIKNISFNELTTGTELVSSKGGFINELRFPELEALKGVRARNVYDYNDRKNYWFEYLKRKLSVQKSDETVAISEHLWMEEDSLKGSVSAICAGLENCLINSESSIVITSGFICDRRALIMSEKDITLGPNITTNGNNGSGCIFLAKDRILIGEGNYQSTSVSPGTVGYDYIEGYLIAEDQIIIEKADDERIIRDGLEIYGGMAAFGRNSVDDNAVSIQRNLRLLNYSNPTLAVTWDPRYAKISEIFFGLEAGIYKQEVGFKVY